MKIHKIIWLATLSLVSLAGQARAAQSSERADFESLSVEIKSCWTGNRTITIRGDGSYDFAIHKPGQPGSSYESNYQLGPEHLRELEGLLEATGWLTEPGAGKHATDATEYELTLVRPAQQKTVTCRTVDRSEEYDSLVRFIERINRQEWLFYNAIYIPNGMRMVVHELESELDAVEGQPYSVYAPVLDYGRLTPIFEEILADPSDKSTDAVIVAIRLVSFLGDETEREHIVALARDRDGAVRRAVIDALCRFGGAESVNIVRGLLRNTGQAAWGLVRLGEPAVPTIIEIVEQPPNDYDSSTVDIIRAYIDNWENVPKPLDKRIVKAVQEDMDYRLAHGGGWTSYHQELLGLAGVTDADRKRTAEAGHGRLSGRITGSNGESVSGYEVELSGSKGGKFTCSSDEQGRYELSSLPAGLYQLVCHPKGDNHPRIAIAKVRIKQNETAVTDLSFERKYGFSGKVSYADGRPAAGMTVRGIWSWMGAKVSMEVFARTDNDGSYTLGVPFDGPALDISVGCFPANLRGPRQPYRNVEPGRTDINFVLRKTAGREDGPVDAASAGRSDDKASSEADELSDEWVSKTSERIRKADEHERALILKDLIVRFQSEEDTKKRLKILRPLAFFGRDRAAASVLTDIARNDEERSVRKFAAHLLGYVGSEDDIDDLLEVIRTDKGAFPHGRDVAGAAYQSIGEIGGDKAAKVLLELWHTKEFVADGSLYVIGVTGSPTVLDLLEEVLAGKEQRFRPNAAVGLGALAGGVRDNKEAAERVHALLRKYAKDSNPEVRQRALTGFYSIGRTEDLPLIESLVDDPYSNVVSYTEDGQVKEKTVYPIREAAEWAIVKIKARAARIAEMTRARAKAAWGGPVNGPQLGLEFESGKRSYREGEVVGFKLHVENVSDGLISLVHYGPHAWAPTVTDSEGKPAFVTIPPWDEPVQERLHALSPGQVETLGTVYLHISPRQSEIQARVPYATLPPSRYKVSQTCRFPSSPRATWSGELTSGEIELVVVPVERRQQAGPAPAES